MRFFDKLSWRYIECSPKDFQAVVDEVNRRLFKYGSVSLNEFYAFLYYSPIPSGDKIGWTLADFPSGDKGIGISFIISNVNCKPGLSASELIIRPEPWILKIKRTRAEQIDILRKYTDYPPEAKGENKMGTENKIDGRFYALKTFDLKIKKVIFNDPATIVFWSDGTKTVVKAGPNDAFDPEKGLAMALSKKVLGNNYKAYGRFKKWLPKEYREKPAIEVPDSPLAEACRNLSESIREGFKNAASKN